MISFMGDRCRWTSFLELGELIRERSCVIRELSAMNERTRTTERQNFISMELRPLNS